MDIEKVGKAIAYHRKRVGYTQKELADRLGISDKAVSKWERGQGLPEIGSPRRLSILLDTDTDSLLSGSMAHHNNDWHGLLIIRDNEYGIGAGTIIYDKPLIYFLFGYFMLLGIKTISIICNDENRRYIEHTFGNGSEYGIQIKCVGSIRDINSEDAANLMIIYGKSILYGVDQTRFFLRAMTEREKLTILALPKRETPLHMDWRLMLTDSSKSAILRKQYDYSRIPFLFLPAKLFSALSESESVAAFIEQNDVFVELLDRGFVEFEVENWEDVQDASSFIRIVQDRCGMQMYCLEEVAWRRGLISLDQLKNLGEKKKNTESGKYLLNLYASKTSLNGALSNTAPKGKNNKKKRKFLNE